MDIKLIATDLDGTLMSPDHKTITGRTLTALKKAHEKGVKIAISTGRTLSLIKEVYSQLPFVDYIIHSNGAVVYDCKSGKNIFEKLIDKDITHGLLTMLCKMPLFCNAYIDGNMYMQKDPPEISGELGLPKAFIDHYISVSVPCNDLIKDTSGKEAEIISAYFASKEDKKKIFDFTDSHGLCHVSSVMDNIEIISSEAGKGAAVDHLCKLIGCTRDNVMTFGDAENDCSMLEYAKYSFAMANGDDKCKKSAAFTTDSNAEDGVAKAIEKYVLN